MQNYLDSYRQSERERIVMGVLNQVYAEIAEMRPSPNKGIEWTLNWSIETLFLYQMFKPYLSTSSAKSYAKPLLGVYEMVIREAKENLKDKIETQEKIEKLKQHFEEILEIEESKRY